MRSGRFPGQEEALSQRLPQLVEERARAIATRRLFLGLALGGAAGACAGSAATRALGATSDNADSDSDNDNRGGAPHRAADGAPSADAPAAGDAATPTWMAELATGPTDQLLRAHTAFLATAMDATPDQHTVWLGVARLAGAVVGGEAGRRSGLRAGLRALRGKPDLPAYVRAWLQRIPPP